MVINMTTGTTTNFSEKEILSDALNSTKAATSNYNTFSNECVHENVRQAMLHCLEQEHDIQQDLFEIMHAKGYYPTPAADEKKVQNTIQTFSQCAKNC